ncbi:MAG: flavodoxin-dependent (E)-4-hydroxy-3-methylbut-2-enyl-diphosphate synthase [bacterium]|nr:flavodoxin-dependent (E)-4-hydroxy-3-methylbut-2-enyl-diphosphate synthase [bacterium]
MKTIAVQVGKIVIGGGSAIAIQSMINTPTRDVKRTVQQAEELIEAGSELVRITVNTPEAAQAVPYIKEQLVLDGYEDVPLIGDFHYNGHLLLTRYKGCAEYLDKYRINPGNVGFGDKHNYNFGLMVDVANQFKKPIRIGVNWGSLDQDLFTKMMDENGKRKQPKGDRDVVIDAMVESAIRSAQLAEKLGMPSNRIILSVKMSEVQDMVKAYQLLHKKLQQMRKPYPLHLGLTEAGAGMRGAISSSAALAILLQQGIGDTIRISLTPTPDRPRTDEVEACKLLLQTMGIRSFKPLVTSCPGCGRTSNEFYQKLAQEVNRHIEKKMKNWKEQYPGVEKLIISVMGCVVNGPGESKHADIGISLPGDMEKPVAHVYKDQTLFKTLQGKRITEEFIVLLDDYICKRFS